MTGKCKSLDFDYVVIPSSTHLILLTRSWFYSAALLHTTRLISHDHLPASSSVLQCLLDCPINTDLKWPAIHSANISELSQMCFFKMPLDKTMSIRHSFSWQHIWLLFLLSLYLVDLHSWTPVYAMEINRKCLLIYVSYKPFFGCCLVSKM